jgi:hypothetical protein
MIHTEHAPTTLFVDSNFDTWYADALPPQLAEQFPNGLQLPEHIQDFEGQELPNFEASLRDVLVASHEPRNAYHNWTHGARTVENAASGYDALQRKTGLKIPEGFLQPALLGTAAHDCGHPGATFFADADPDRIPTGASVTMPVEAYSARYVSEFIAQQGATPAQQLVAAYKPISSTYGAQEAQGKALGIQKATNPKGISGLMMRAVDVVPDGGDYAASVAEDVGVLYGERRPVGKPALTSLEDYYNERKGFIEGYVLPSFDRLDAAVGTDLTAYTGWRQRARHRLAQIDTIYKGTNPVLRSVLLSRLAANYGIELA